VGKRQFVEYAARAGINVQEAVEYSGISEACLRRLVKTGALPASKDWAMKIRRLDLDNLVASGLGRECVEWSVRFGWTLDSRR
jgi:hypothetical protein